MHHAPLFTPVSLGSLALANRIVMAPLTRCRADADHVPTAIMADYYAQRASAGLIVAEATMAMAGNSAFGGREPGIYSAAQVAARRTVTEAVHAHCAPHGLTWPVDFASKGSSQVGGNIATNAGGVKVIRYGLTRQWVLGLEVVLMSGEVLALNGALEKNNTGVDLRQLFIGSEGILGVLTAATLKLARLPGHLDVLLFALPDLASVLTLFGEARRGPFTVSAYEFFTDRCLARVRAHRKVREPFAAPSPYYVLLEVEAHDAAGVAITPIDTDRSKRCRCSASRKSAAPRGVSWTDK